MQENPAYLTEQIITYIGNKRALLDFIGQGVRIVQERLHKEKLSGLDAFSGSGIVSRYLRRFCHTIYSNDLEDYAAVINACYMSNRSSVDMPLLQERLEQLRQRIHETWHKGLISAMYAPADEEHITGADRVFYTKRNAAYIDTARRAIEELPEEERKYFLAPLLYGASVHNNTAGVFKGFYKNRQGVGQFGGQGKNALQRILGDIELVLPVFSNFEVDWQGYQQDARTLMGEVPELDFAYFDPPYNQHPYGSNYFMLNVIANYRAGEGCSKVSGIPNDWNRSAYNKRALAQRELFDTVAACPAKFVLISYNSEGFVPYDVFTRFLADMGKVQVLQTPYNAFRGSRNLNARATKVTEFLFLVEKR